MTVIPAKRADLRSRPRWSRRGNRGARHRRLDLVRARWQSWVVAAVLCVALAALDALAARRIAPASRSSARAARLAAARRRARCRAAARQSGAQRRCACDVHDHHPRECEVRGLPQRVTRARARLGGAPLRAAAGRARRRSRSVRVEMRLASPLGLWHARRDARRSRRRLRVYPNFAALAKYALLATDNRLSQIGVLQRRRRGEGLEFHQLREYREGDTPAADRLEGDRARGQAHLARVPGRARPADRVPDRLRAAAGAQRRRAVALRPRAERRAAARLRERCARATRSGFLTMSGRARASWRRASPRATVTAMLNQLYDLQPTLAHVRLLRRARSSS